MCLASCHAPREWPLCICIAASHSNFLCCLQSVLQLRVNVEALHVVGMSVTITLWLCLQGSPQLSVELLRFGSGLGPARHLSGLAAGSFHASFHGPHEAEDRGMLAQALSRHMSGQALPAGAPHAAAPPAAEEADEEQTVRTHPFLNSSSQSQCCCITRKSWSTAHVEEGL